MGTAISRVRICGAVYPGQGRDRTARVGRGKGIVRVRVGVTAAQARGLVPRDGRWLAIEMLL
jgi:hypothetical protein